MAIVQKVYKETLLLTDGQFADIQELLSNNLQEEDFVNIGTKRLWDAQTKQIGSCLKVFFNDKVYVRYYVFLDADNKSHVRLELCQTKPSTIFTFNGEEKLKNIKSNSPVGRFCFKINGITYILTVKAKSCKLGNVYNIGAN
jgi:hypothetical protein